jgi:hypothetical protein
MTFIEIFMTKISIETEKITLLKSIYLNKYVYF